MPSREQIRQRLQTVIASVFTGTIFTTRYPDARELFEFVCVHIQSGETEHGFGSSITTAELIVSINKQGAEDSDLDSIGESITSAIQSDAVLRSDLVGLYQTGFNYDPLESDGAMSLNLKFTIMY
ncbi:MAG: hypothetical protein IPM37_23095 [Hahellaceae bacterium]|nr:hypothetical protein [Hahellaceae bacterium]